jgi:hypothetical protein
MGSENRKFGFLVGGVAMVIALFGRHHLSFGGPAIALLGLAAFAPTLLERPRKLWLRGGAALGRFNARIFLTLFFFVVLTPLGWLKRRLGGPVLQLGFDPSQASYAEPARKREPGHFKFQF